VPQNERGRQNGDPIPNSVLADNLESKTQILARQAISLARRCPINAAMAEALAPMVFGVLT
jgi:hypothetical protein